MIKIAAAFLLLSGIASLTYQVAWVRLLGLSMGSTSASISTVLAAFFLGLAMGSYLAERITRNNIDSLKVYIYLEVVIGLAGLALLPILLNLDSYLAAAQLGLTIPIKFALTMALLIIPTICMGATFPVMASLLIRRNHEVGLRMSQLYSLNTAGAVLGAALAGFVFIPKWGLDGAVYIAFSINMLIVIAAIYLDRTLSLPPLEVKPSDVGEEDARGEAPFRGRALIVLFATGLVAIASEVGWTKYLSIFTGTTIYGFAAILTVFLIGIAAGSWAIRSHLEKIQRPDVWMALGLLLLGASLLLTRAGLAVIPPLYSAVNHLPGSVANTVKYTLVFLLLFPPTFIFGALFPLNLKLYCGSLHGVRTRIGRAYAVNTVASIFGSVMAGFWIIPQYGTDALLTVVAIFVLLIPLLFVPTFARAAPRYAIPVIAVLLVLSNWVFPHISYKQLIKSVQYKYDTDALSGRTPEVVYIKEGKAGVISMVSYNGRHMKLQNNGLNESLIDTEDERNVLLVETLLGLVPYILAENPKNAFVVGFGGGITTRSLTLTQLESIKVVELEPAVVEAGRFIAKGEIAALKDPRVVLEFNDARNTLLLENNRYDIIVAQPSHPWLARASTVFTQEFFQIVATRLNPGGVYGQWVNLFNMDATTLKSLFNAFYGVFEHGVVVANISSGDLIMLGSKHKLVFDYDRMSDRMAEPKVKDALNFREIYEPQDLFWYFSLSRDQALQAAAGVEANSDINIFSEVRLSALHGQPKGEEDPYGFLREHYRLAIADYLNGDVTRKLYAFSRRVYGWNEPEMAMHVARQLDSRDEILARAVRFENVWRTGDLVQAESQFAEHEQWSDDSLRLYAMMLSDYGKVEKALEVIARIQDVGIRNAMRAWYLYEQQQWTRLLRLKTTSADELSWQLQALARKDLLKAGKRMLEIKDNTWLTIPHYRLLARYSAAIGDTANVTLYSRRMLKEVDATVKRLSLYVETALKNEHVQEAEQLLGKIALLNPEAKEILNLKSLIAKKRENLSSLQANNFK
ncbi:MAG: fused MFS/spermidine synthase [Gammaproteobacteria bacterium]|nr:fused MFS/spermidine synthase [Gammaproteobacteria bacterium]MDH5803269.1 fused MFS/spermidine synthase [Gammaproteobacteria bacterium]